jgi:hypothetical protein
MDRALAQYLQCDYGQAFGDLGGSFTAAAGAIPFAGAIPRLLNKAKSAIELQRTIRELRNLGVYAPEAKARAAAKGPRLYTPIEQLDNVYRAKRAELPPFDDWLWGGR